MSWFKRQTRYWWQCYCGRVLEHDARNQVELQTPVGYTKSVYVCDACLATLRSPQGKPLADEIVKRGAP